MKKVLTKMVLFHTVAGVIINGVHDRVSGDVSGISGDVSGIRGDVNGIRGDVSGIWGYVSGIRGDVSGIRGDVDLSELTDEERSDGININNLIMEQE